MMPCSVESDSTLDCGAPLDSQPFPDDATHNEEHANSTFNM
jgi:hypothetical protein